MAAMPLHTGGLPQGELLGRYRNYEDAQKVVDHLAGEQDFDVKALTIVGNELRSVEKVRGRLSYPRAAGTGALQGALFGTFMGLLLMLFSPQDPLMSLGMAVLMGMAIWMIIAVIGFAARRGSRGFVSASQLVATTFDVVCDFQAAGRARRLVKESGVTSLNAWNDPTGKSAALTTGVPSQAPQGAAPQQATAVQGTAQRTTTTPVAESAGSAGEPERSEERGPSSSSQERAVQHEEARVGSGQPDSRFEEDGRPRYGVRLADVQEPEPPQQDGTAGSGAEDSASEQSLSDESPDQDAETAEGK